MADSEQPPDEFQEALATAHLTTDDEPAEAEARPFLPNWWCYRRQPVSGLYRGEGKVGANTYRLDLRVDIDQRHANSPVLNMVSADLHQEYTFKWFGRIFSWTVYRNSWVMENPTVKWSRCGVVITGDLKFFPPPGVRYILHEATINIAWSFGVITSATAVVKPKGMWWSTGTTYKCKKVSNAFRELTLEIDYCDSVDNAPTLPSYDTTWHPNRPTNIAQRTLTIEEAYLEAGIDISMNPTHTVIDDSAAAFNTWSVAELHDAMETHFSRYTGGWPKWHMWGLLAGSYDNPLVGGIMFDAASAYGGSGEAPERQGFAVFKDHSWWTHLVAGTPTTDAEAAAMRKFLHTFVHEAGHAFNFVHSWNKSRPDSLSYMNYDWKYDNRNGANSYWNNFHFQFDNEELTHLRHGDRKAVIPGGDPWATGLHATDPDEANDTSLVVDGGMPIELLLRSKLQYDFLEPVVIEARLRNLADLPIDVDTRLEPEFGNVAYFIRTPDGRTITYAPVLCMMGDAATQTLQPAPDLVKGAVEGADRRSVEIRLGFGAGGFYFAEPGEYWVRAVYHDPSGVVVPSNVTRVRIGRPYSRSEERLGAEVYSREAGLALYLGGSSSPFLAKGRAALEEVLRVDPEGGAAAEIANVLAADYSRPFFRVNEKGKLYEARKREPARALKLAEATLKQHGQDASRVTNLALGRAVKTKAAALAASRKKEDARKAIRAVVRTLKQQGVNKPVLDEMEAFAKTM